jgi:hypothetical protein
VAAYGDIKKVELFSVIARCIWLRRNQVIHENAFLHPNQLLRDLLTSLEEYKIVNVMADEAPKQQTILSSNPWQSPPASMIKINWNIVVGQNCGRIGFGVIV